MLPRSTMYYFDFNDKCSPWSIFLQNVLKIKHTVLAYYNARETVNCCSGRTLFLLSPRRHACRTTSWCLALSRLHWPWDMRHGGLWVLQTVTSSQPQLHPCSPSDLHCRGQVEMYTSKWVLVCFFDLASMLGFPHYGDPEFCQEWTEWEWQSGWQGTLTKYLCGHSDQEKQIRRKFRRRKGEKNKTEHEKSTANWNLLWGFSFKGYFVVCKETWIDFLDKHCCSPWAWSFSYTYIHSVHTPRQLWPRRISRTVLCGYRQAHYCHVLFLNRVLALLPWSPTSQESSCDSSKMCIRAPALHLKTLHFTQTTSPQHSACPGHASSLSLGQLLLIFPSGRLPLSPRAGWTPVLWAHSRFTCTFSPTCPPGPLAAGILCSACRTSRALGRPKVGSWPPRRQAVGWMGSQASWQSESELKLGAGKPRQIDARGQLSPQAAGSPQWFHVFIQGPSWSVTK